MDRGTWWATSHGVAKSRTELSDSAAAAATSNCLSACSGEMIHVILGVGGAASEDIDVGLIKKFLRVFQGCCGQT